MDWWIVSPDGGKTIAWAAACERWARSWLADRNAEGLYLDCAVYRWAYDQPKRGTA